MAPVVYDPCTYISDDEISAAGFDPASRDREDADDFATSLGCYFTSETRVLAVTSVNNGFDVYRRNTAEKARDLAPINGRAAFMIATPERHSCQIVMKTTVGLAALLVITDVTYWDVLDPCDGIEGLAAIIEPTIGAAN